MKFIRSVLFILFAIVICYLLWLLFYWITPYFMALSWMWMIIIFSVAGGLLFPIFTFFPSILSAAIAPLKSSHIAETTILSLVVLFFAFSSCRLAWMLNISSGEKELVFAIAQNVSVLGAFWAMYLSFIATHSDY